MPAPVVAAAPTPQVQKPLFKQPIVLPSKTFEEDNGEEEEESGLLFVDPQQEKRAQLEKEKLLKKKEPTMITLKDGTIVPSSALLPMQAGLHHGVSGASHGAAGGEKNRWNYL